MRGRRTELQDWERRRIQQEVGDLAIRVQPRPLCPFCAHPGPEQDAVGLPQLSRGSGCLRFPSVHPSSSQVSLSLAVTGPSLGPRLRIQSPCGDRTDAEVKMPDLAEVLRNALSLDVHDRATLAEKLLASLEELGEEEADHLWAEEAHRRLEEYHAGRAKAVQAEAVHEKAERLLR